MGEWEPTVEQVSLGADAINQIAAMQLEGQEQPNWLIARTVLTAVGGSIREETVTNLGPVKYIAYPCGEHVGIIYGHLTCPAEEHDNGTGDRREVSSPYQGNGRGPDRSSEEVASEALPQHEDPT